MPLHAFSIGTTLVFKNHWNSHPFIYFFIWQDTGIKLTVVRIRNAIHWIGSSDSGLLLAVEKLYNSSVWVSMVV